MIYVLKTPSYLVDLFFAGLSRHALELPLHQDLPVGVVNGSVNLEGLGSAVENRKQSLD